MPKVQVTNAKGLVQIKEGTGVDIQNELAFSNGGGVVLPTSSPTGTSTVLTNADSGSVLALNSTSALTVTLPTDANCDIGCHYKFIVQTTNDNAYTISTGDNADSGGDDFVGGVRYTDETRDFDGGNRVFGFTNSDSIDMTNDSLEHRRLIVL